MSPAAYAYGGYPDIHSVRVAVYGEACDATYCSRSAIRHDRLLTSLVGER
jgi:hypothetical protein